MYKIVLRSKQRNANKYAVPCLQVAGSVRKGDHSSFVERRRSEVLTSVREGEAGSES